MSDTDEPLQHEMSGFNAYEAFNNQISESSLSELNHIINALLKHDKTIKILKLQDDIKLHLNKSPDAHDLDISKYSEDLLIQLYRHYREMGYTGTLNEMLLQLEKDVTVGDHTDMVAGYDSKKAVNVVEWQWRFDRHQNDQYAHEQLLDVFRPDYILNIRPTLSIDYRYNYDINPVDLNIPYWNESDGTINIEISTDSASPIDSDIVNITDGSHTIKVHLLINTNVQIQFIIDDNVVGTSTYDNGVPTLFINRISITYNAQRISFRDLFRTIVIDRPSYSFIPNKIYSDLTIRKDSNGLRALMLYRQGISILEQNFFLD